jgi:uncharacterized protein with gpF-like domain
MADEIDQERARQLLQQIDLGDWDVLTTELADEIQDIFADGLMASLPVTGADVSVDQVNERALEYAREHAAELVTMIEENTRDMLQDTVAQAIEEGWSADQLAEEIASSTGFSVDRAEMISRTELLTGYNSGNMAGYREAARQGIRLKKEWLVGGDPCPICEENEAAGPIPLDEDFPSGDDAPGAHPRCECSVAAVLDDDAEQDEESDAEEF